MSFRSTKFQVNPEICAALSVIAFLIGNVWSSPANNTLGNAISSACAGLSQPHLQSSHRHVRNVDRSGTLEQAAITIDARPAGKAPLRSRTHTGRVGSCHKK